MKSDFNIYTYVCAYEIIILIIIHTYVCMKFSYYDLYVRTYVPIMPDFIFGPYIHMNEYIILIFITYF